MTEFRADLPASSPPRAPAAHDVGIGRQARALVTSWHAPLAQERQFAQNLGALLGSTSYAHVASILVGIVVGRWVEPADYGIWVAFSLVPSYLGWLHLGTHNGLGRELPLALGQNDLVKAQRLIGTAVVVGVAAACLSLLLLPFVVHWVVPDPGAALLIGTVSIAVVVVANLATGALYMIGRSYGAFRALSIIAVLQTTAGLPAIALIWMWGLPGLFSRLVVMQVVQISASLWTFRRHLALGFDMPSLLTLWRVGVPIFFVGYLATLGPIIDRTIVAVSFRPEELGMYGFAVFIFTSTQLVATSALQILFPEMVAAYGKHGTVSAVWPLVRRHFVWIATLLPVPLVALAWLLPSLLQWLVPAYADAAGPARILLLATAITSFGGIFGNVLNTIGWSWMYCAAIALQLGTLTLAVLVAVWGGYGLTGVAWANVVSSAVLALSTLALCAAAARRDRPFNLRASARS